MAQGKRKSLPHKFEGRSSNGTNRNHKLKLRGWKKKSSSKLSEFSNMRQDAWAGVSTSVPQGSKRGEGRAGRGGRLQDARQVFTTPRLGIEGGNNYNTLYIKQN